jgi:hypothetical protein
LFVTCIPIVALVALCLAATPSSAQERSGSQAAQYVFVVDDSGSMSREVSGVPAADPDRLAVFGVRSIVSMLNDRDEATVVRLNGPADGEAPPPLESLSENRETLRKRTSLTSTLAEYAGQRTPCRSALEAVKSELKSAHRPGVPQVVMFLTDGACTGEEPDPARFLRGLSSASEDLLKFYLLRFSDRSYTESLADLASRTGGDSIQVSADKPTSILEPFASALSDSQGYRSYLLTPSDATLDAHSAARRMRLLAVAPGEGSDLSIGAEGRRSGDGPEPMEGSERTGVHQFENGRTFRYAALDYKPGDNPVTVDVDGAGSNWKVVAVPEYRLFTRTQIYQGECGTGQREVASVEVGASACVEVRLVNGQGEVVSGEAVSGDTEAIVRYREPGSDESRKLPANRVGNEARYRLERVNLEEGSHVFDPVVELAAPGGGDRSVDVEGAARTLQVSTLRASASPSELSIGEMQPGANEFYELDIEGNFPSTSARLTLRDRDEIPQCLQFSLSDVPEGEAQEITAGQTYTVVVNVAPYCGPTAIDRRFDTSLRIEFANSSTRSVPTLVVPISFALRSELSVPEALEVDVTGGGAARTSLELSGNFMREANFEALVPPVGERQNWPDGDRLQIQFLDDRGELVKQGSRAAGSAPVIYPPGGGGGADIQIVADRCCDGGSYETEIALVPESGSSEPIRIPLRADVEAAGFVACWGETMLIGLGVLLLILAALYGYGMYISTHLVDPDRMADKIKPLVYDGYGNPQPGTGNERGRARESIEDEFADNRWERVRAWFAANPLRFGLPGETYNECIQFSVEARRPEVWIGEVKGHRNFRSEVDRDPAKQRKFMFVQAHPSLEFFAVPDERQNVEGLIFERSYGGGFDEPGNSVVKLRGDQLLRGTEGQEGDIAGWEIG